MYSQDKQMSLEESRTHIERIMMGLDKKKPDKERRMYLAGVIDTLADFKIISDDTRGKIYSEYCF